MFNHSLTGMTKSNSDNWKSFYELKNEYLLPFRIKEIIIICIFSLLGTFVIYNFINPSPEVAYAFGSTQDYNFNKPTATIQLPKILHEISGLTDIDNKTLALVQDEDGIVFIYDWRKEIIIKEIPFGESGDYEGITKVGNSIYVLRSDGYLFEIENFEREDFKVNKYNTDIPVKDNEGLGYDSVNNQLLIAGKSEPKGDEYTDKRAVFAFDLNTKSMEKQPAYIFSEENIRQFVKENKSTLSGQETELDLKINPSAIAVHPNTGKLFVLSSKDKLIYIFNQENELEGVHSLNRKIHTQPEGITFLENGDLFISNEGAEGEPTLLQFLYNK